MNNKKKVESKNVKRFYVPKTVVIYFSDLDITMYEDFNKNIVEYTEFIQIGSIDRSRDDRKMNRFNKKFYSWIEYKKNEERISKPSTFFNNAGSEISKILKSTDIAVVVYKSNDMNTLEYVDELTSILSKNDVFSFHLTVENFVQSMETTKRYQKLIKSYTKKRQVYLPVKEESIVLAYKDATIANRRYYTNLYINNLLDSFIAPFLDPKRNPDSFSKTKALFYQDKKNFESKVVSAMGYSDAKNDNVDLALIQALSNPMFAAAYDASETFIVNVKMPFFTDEHLTRLKEVLKSVVGDWKKFYVSTYVGSFEYDKYCQVSIMAINVDESKLINDPDKVNQYIKKILNNVQKSKQLFEGETKTLILGN